jgi:membrane protein implicated in regulation of membrane protease activity
VCEAGIVNVRARYALLQLPGWILAAAVLYALHRWLGLPLWVAGILMVADLAKDVLLFPYLRRAYETDERTGAERLIGARAEVYEPLDPTGYVRIRGELWKARLSSGETGALAGSYVRVENAEGLILEVSRENGSDLK